MVLGFAFNATAATPVDNQACRTNITRFLQVNYKTAQYLGAKAVTTPAGFHYLNKMEKHAMKMHLRYLKKHAPNFEAGERYGIGTRLHRANNAQYLITDVTTDINFLARTVIVYRLQGGDVQTKAAYYNDNYNEPLFNCF